MSDGLVDLLDRLVDTGVGAAGDVTLSVAGVDLIALRLQTILHGIGTEGAGELTFPHRSRPAARLPARMDTSDDPAALQRGLAQLVLVIVELLGELMERQAVRRLAAGTVTDDEAGRLGRAFVALHEQLEDLQRQLAPA